MRGDESELQALRTASHPHMERKPNPVPMKVEELFRAAAELGMNIDTLGERLQPVLTPRPEGGVPEDRDRPSQSSLAHQLDDLASTLWSMNRRVAELTDSVEV